VVTNVLEEHVAVIFRVKVVVYSEMGEGQPRGCGQVCVCGGSSGGGGSGGGGGGGDSLLHRMFGVALDETFEQVHFTIPYS
jgi:hypothetical protein